MTDSSQSQAGKSYRSRLVERGLVRFEVRGRGTDRELVRWFARRLAEGGPEADRLRRVVQQETSDKPTTRGRILEALRRSPLVGADAVLSRPFVPARKTDF